MSKLVFVFLINILAIMYHSRSDTFEANIQPKVKKKLEMLLELLIKFNLPVLDKKFKRLIHC